MGHILKIIMYVLRELVFDSKDEYDFSSAKFNFRKFTVAIMLGLSLFANYWMVKEYLIVVKVRDKCEARVEMLANATTLAIENSLAACPANTNKDKPPSISSEKNNALPFTPQVVQELATKPKTPTEMAVKKAPD